MLLLFLGIWKAAGNTGNTGGICGNAQTDKDAVARSSHGTAQAATPPTLSVAAGGYTPGVPLALSMSITNYRGILIFATDSTGAKVGTWTTISGTTTAYCPGGQTVTHTNANTKSSLPQLTLPAGTTGPITINAFIVISTANWYNNVQLTITPAPTGAPTPMTPTAPTAPTAPTRAPVRSPTRSPTSPTASPFTPTASPIPATTSSNKIASGDFVLSWTISSDKTSVTFTMSHKTTGWFSFGLSTTAFHQSMDCWTAYYDTATSKVRLFTGPSNSLANAKPVYTELTTGVSGSRVGGVTSVTWTRPTSSPTYNVQIGNSNNLAFWAIRAADTDITQIHDGASKAISTNFLTGKSVELATEYSPAWLLCVVMVCIVALYAIVHWSRKYMKYRKQQELAKVVEKTRGQGTIADGPMVANPAVEFAGGRARGPTQSYMKGDQVVEYQQEAPLYGNQPAPTVNAVKVEQLEIEKQAHPNFVAACCSAFFSLRVPKSHVSVLDITLWTVYVLINVACLFFGTRTWANKVGSIAIANALFIVIPATRNGVLGWVLGLPFDRVIVFHRWLGRWTMFLVFVHMILYWIDWLKLGGSVFRDQQFKDLGNFWGFWATICGIWIIVTSLYVVRRKKFEFFFWAHFAFIGFYVFAYLHTRKTSWYVVYTAVVYLLDRLIRFLWGFIPSKSVLCRYKDGNIVQIRYPKHPLAELLGLYRVGQYVFLNFPQISLTEWHPFSVSSGPRELTGEVHIRGLGDHTNKLVQAAKDGRQLWVRVDGPYGNHRLNYRRYPLLLLVGGGIGITPVIGIVKDVYNVGDVGKQTPNTGIIESVFVVWTIRKETEYEWFRQELEQCLALQGRNGMPNLNLWIYVTQNGGDLSNPAFVPTRPNFDSVFDTIGQSNRDKSCVVFACGPAPMVNDCWDHAVLKTASGVRYDFHHETFEF